MKNFNEIKSIVDAQDELEMLSKPESITKEEYTYYLSIEKIEREINSMKLELERKENELNILITNPDYFRLNEGI
jgi:hypothetical protein